MAENVHLGGAQNREVIEHIGPYVEKHWFAVYTTCRHEKRVAQHLEQRGLEFYLPLYRTQRRWKDRSLVTLDLPLFPGYIFVRIDWFQRVSVLQVPGVLSLVGGTWPHITPLPEFEITALRQGLDPRRAAPHPLLLKGDKVRISNGPLAGLEGMVERNKNALRVVLTLELIMQSISVEVDANDLEPLQVKAELARSSPMQPEAARL